MIHPFFWAVGENAVGAAILALAVLGITRFWKNPTVRHSLWLLVLLKLVVPPLFSLPLMQTPVRSLTHSVQIAASLPVDRSEPGPLPGRTNLAAPPAEVAPRAYGPIAAPDRGVAPDLLGQLSASVLLAAAWAAGSIVWLAIAGVRIVRFHRAVNRAAAADVHISEMAAEVARRLGYGRPVEVRVSRGQFPPLLWAVGHAKIVLPEFAVTGLTTTQTRGILAHEIAHLVRRDHWVRWLELVVFACYWWNPVAWWARREMRAAEEQACDARVVDRFAGIDQSYVEALLAIIDRAAAFANPVPSVASALGGAGTLKRRVEAIVVHRDWRWGKSGVAIVAVAAISLVCSVRSVAEEPPAAEGPPAAAPAAVAPVAVEFFIGEDKPDAGLKEAKVEGNTDDLIYLHAAPVATQADIAEASENTDINGHSAVNINFTDAGAKKMLKATAENIGKRIAVVVDGKVIFTAIIRSKISDRAQITFGTKTTVKKLLQAVKPAEEQPDAAPAEKTEPQKPIGGAKLPPESETKLRWGEPAGGLRAALLIRPASEEPPAADMPDLYLVVQNVSDAPIRFADLTPAPRKRAEVDPKRWTVFCPG